MNSVLLIGATGHLGSYIARALIERGADLRLYVRPDSRHKLGDDIASARHVEVVGSERGAFDGVQTVVSAVQGGPDVIIDTQLRLLDQARAAGVRRFIPSTFSFNLFGLGEGENINSDWRREFARRADNERGSVDVVHVLNGCFLDEGVFFEFVRGVDLDLNEAYLWGDGNEKMQFTTFADTAAYTAAAALDDRELPREFFVAGDMLTFHEFVDATSAGLGRPITVIPMGSLTDLDAEIDRRMRQEPDNMLSWLPLMYWRGMLNGKGKPGPLLNDRYPDIKPIGVREYVAGLSRQQG
ncbi:NmrA family NAD(P)-binding protein [Mycobacterium sp. ML4]